MISLHSTDAFIWLRQDGLFTEVDEMAIFGREVIGRLVVDRTGTDLGNLTDIHFDLKTGAISELVVTVRAGGCAREMARADTSQPLRSTRVHSARVAREMARAETSQSLRSTRVRLQGYRQ